MYCNNVQCQTYLITFNNISVISSLRCYFFLLHYQYRKNRCTKTGKSRWAFHDYFTCFTNLYLRGVLKVKFTIWRLIITFSPHSKRWLWLRMKLLHLYFSNVYCCFKNFFLLFVSLAAAWLEYKCLKIPKRVIIIRISKKGRQQNGQRTNNDLQ